MVLITGAGGFLGGYIVDEFLKEGHQVRAMVRPKSDKSHLKGTKAEIVTADITDSSQLRSALYGAETVIHSAAILGGGAKKREDFIHLNYEAAKNFANLCVEFKIKRFTFISSMAAAGPVLNSAELIDENTIPNPSSFYGESKYLAEKYLLNLQRDKKLDVVILRPALIYGPRDKRCAVNYLRIANLGFFPVPMQTAGKKSSFIYVTDAAKAVYLAHQNSKPGEIYMLSSDTATVKEFVEILMRCKGKPAFIIYIPKFVSQMLSWFFCLIPRGGELNKRLKHIGSGNWAVDNTKLKTMLGFNPEVTLEEGLKKTWSFYRSGSSCKKLLNVKYVLKNL